MCNQCIFQSWLWLIIIENHFSISTLPNQLNRIGRFDCYFILNGVMLIQPTWCCYIKMKTNRNFIGWQETEASISTWALRRINTQQKKLCARLRIDLYVNVNVQTHRDWAYENADHEHEQSNQSNTISDLSPILLHWKKLKKKVWRR